ncbi:polyprenyl synthetase family protein [Thermococcus sp.]|uniref:polyprenyl synthetase family protein n=1 Tax=Thermococcus sp. TaxID=35749 RepID=UPI002617A0E3|nr:polyprenyl synthetase family protein [Thermococcus sp.]
MPKSLRIWSKAKSFRKPCAGAFTLTSKIIDGKTGRLFGAAFALPPYYLEKPYWMELDKAGTLVGRAFQIIDDVLDYFPGTGKDRFKDLLNGKATLPLILYTERYGSSLVERILKNPSEENLLELFERIVSAGVFEESLKIAREYVKEALKLIEDLPFDGSDVVRLVSGYFENVFERVNVPGGLAYHVSQK